MMICATGGPDGTPCPVLLECRQYRKITGSEFGVWGAQYFRRGDD